MRCREINKESIGKKIIKLKTELVSGRITDIIPSKENVRVRIQYSLL